MNMCPTCTRAGDSIGTCGSTHTCGAVNQRPIDPSKDVVISCAQCDLLLAVPLEEITQARATRICAHGRDACKATLVNSKAGAKR